MSENEPRNNIEETIRAIREEAVSDLNAVARALEINPRMSDFVFWDLLTDLGWLLVSHCEKLAEIRRFPFIPGDDARLKEINFRIGKAKCCATCRHYRDEIGKKLCVKYGIPEYESSLFHPTLGDDPYPSFFNPTQGAVCDGWEEKNVPDGKRRSKWSITKEK